jgi:hypothetical protein
MHFSVLKSLSITFDQLANCWDFLSFPHTLIFGMFFLQLPIVTILTSNVSARSAS